LLLIGGVKQGEENKTFYFLALNVNILKTVRDTAKVSLLLMTIGLIGNYICAFD